MSNNFNEILHDISHIVGKKKSFKYKLKNGLFNIYWGITISNNLDFKYANQVAISKNSEAVSKFRF